jgi:hypothetical protein
MSNIKNLNYNCPTPMKTHWRLDLLKNIDIVIVG